jgi:ArsR family metal-binding transcriptional regulator
MTDALTTFGDRREFERARLLVERLGIDHVVVSPDPAYARVGCPALVLSPEAKAEYLDGGGAEIVDAGWAEYRPSTRSVPDEPPPDSTDDLIRRMVLVVLAQCVADPRKLRLIAHLAGDASEALPYLNAELQQASYVAKLPVLTFMEEHRMISLFRDRVAIAKADDIVDAWASLERVRRMVNDVWARRDEIEPSFEARRRPPALEIYKRLPGTNCRECGEAGCMAFAWAVWRGDADPRYCRPVFDGERGDLREALLAVCAGLGLGDDAGG